jgi:hypothetical protein
MILSISSLIYFARSFPPVNLEQKVRFIFYKISVAKCKIIPLLSAEHPFIE